MPPFQLSTETLRQDVVLKLLSNIRLSLTGTCCCSSTGTLYHYFTKKWLCSFTAGYFPKAVRLCLQSCGSCQKNYKKRSALFPS